MDMSTKYAEMLILQFGSPTPLLEEIAKFYFPRFSRAKLLEKARLNKFPFKCFRLGDSQKDPYVVDIFSFAKYLSER